jgi:hypothetical protein
MLRALRSAVEELVRRHEALRTVFSPGEGRPVQIVLPAIEPALGEIDLSPLPARDRQAEWSRVVREEGRKLFDLSRAPLFRGTILHLSPQEHQLLFVIHHIVADEWSMEIIQRELKTLVQAFSRGQSSRFRVADPYADFASWQRNWLQGEVLQRQISTGRTNLGASPILSCPPTARPAIQRFRGATEIFQLPKELLEGEVLRPAGQPRSS